MARAVFMGTPELAVPCLEAAARWAADGLAVVTQPDRPKGRSGTPQPSPIKVRAQQLGLEVAQPRRLRDNPEVLGWLRAWQPDVVVVVAFGQLLPPEVLAVPPLGCVNVHFSLLPKYRGAAPVQWAVIHGETESGVDTMLMDAGLDTGPRLLRQTTAIGAEETAGELAARLMQLAPEVLSKTLEELAAGRLTPQTQEPEAASWAPRLKREDGQIAWEESAVAIANRVRGVTPWPGAVATVAGEEVKVLRARAAESVPGASPGSLVALEEAQGLRVAAGEGSVWLREVQAPGRKPVSGAAYARGRRLRPTEAAAGDVVR